MQYFLSIWFSRAPRPRLRRDSVSWVRDEPLSSRPTHCSLEKREDLLGASARDVRITKHNRHLTALDGCSNLWEWVDDGEQNAVPSRPGGLDVRLDYVKEIANL
jgi:hypothetical protein